MLQSELFTKAERNFPKDETSLNAKLLTRAGFIRKISAGVYGYLPLGLRVLHKIKDIVREEMNALGATEVLMSTLVPKEMWEKSTRWETDVMFKTAIEGKEKRHEFGLGWTHEEEAAFLAKQFVSSYKDLPKSFYQLQTKFRAEERAKSGLLRGREFIMKDLYSFHADKADLDMFYKQMELAYQKVFKRIGLKALVVEAGGGPFTKEPTHEFQVLLPVGEDTIFYCEKCDWAKNKEIYGGEKTCPECGAKVLESNAAEVGNIFRLGTRYSEAYDLNYLNDKGENKLVVMGSYGIGITRLMGVLAEIYNDDKGLIWPESVAPFAVHLLEFPGAEDGEKLYGDLQKAGFDVLYDQRPISVGAKLAEADLIGIPWRAVVSAQTKDKVEVKSRSKPTADVMSRTAFIALLKKTL